MAFTKADDFYKGVDNPWKSVSESLLKLDEQLQQISSKTAKEFGEKLDALSVSSDKFGDKLKQLNELEAQSAKAQKELALANNALEKAKQQELKTSQELEKVKQQENKTRKETANAIKAEEQVKQASLTTTRKEIQLKKQGETAANKMLKSIREESSEYKKSSRALTLKQDALKDLIVMQERGIVKDRAARKATKGLKKEIDGLRRTIDKAESASGQFQRNVGNYPKVFKRAQSSIIALNQGLELAKKGMDSVRSVGAGLNSTLNESAEGQDNLTKATSGLSAVWKKGRNILGDLINQLIDGKLSADDFKKTLDDTIDSSKELKRMVDAYGELGVELAKLKRDYAFVGLEISKSNSELSKFESIASDGTRSFNDIQEAALSASKASAKSADLNIENLEKEVHILEQVRLLDLFYGNSTIAIDKQIAESQTALTDARTEAANAQREITKTLVENARDRYERELDFAIDAFDSQKTLQERIIADENAGVTDRIIALKRLRDFNSESFDSQIQLTKDYVAESLMLRDGLSRSEADSIAKRIDLEKLVTLESEKEVRERVSQYNLDDVTLGRILEIYRERIAITQDVVDAENDIKDVITEITAAAKEMNNEVADSFSDLESDIDSIADKLSDEYSDIEERQLEAKDATMQNLSTGLSATADITNAYFAQQDAVSRARVDRQVALIQDRENAGLISARNSERQTQEIRKKSFEEDKKMQKAQAVINGALAVTRILAYVPFGISTAILIAAAISTTAAQVATIDAQEFADGSDSVQPENGIGGKKNKDDIPALLTRGEMVVPVSESEKLSAIGVGRYEVAAMAERGVKASRLMNEFNVSNSYNDISTERLEGIGNKQLAMQRKAMKKKQPVVVRAGRKTTKFHDNGRIETIRM